MKYLIKHNLETLTILCLISTILLVVYWAQLNIPYRTVLIFFIFITLHEWEETRFPGGLIDAISKRLQLSIPNKNDWKLHIFQALFIVTIVALPFIFKNAIWLCLVPFYLGIFEGFIHILGIKIMRLNRPYSPGMITALLMTIPSGYGIYYLATNNLISKYEYLYAFIVLFVLFMIMQQLFLRIGLGIKNITEKIRSIKD